MHIQQGEVSRPLFVWLTYLVIAIATGLLTALILKHPIHGDDAWFAEQAYWLAKEGKVRSEFFTGLLNYEVQLFDYHRLHVWMAALMIKLFGLSHLALKFLTLSYLVLLLIVARRYFSGFLGAESNGIFALFAAFVLINSMILELAFVYRPEMAIMCAGFISYYYLRQGLNDKPGSIAIAGVWAGICTLFHLNGIIFIAAGALVLLIERRPKLLGYFLLTAGIVSGLYFIDIFPDYWNAYWFQFQNNPSFPRNQFEVLAFLSRFYREYERFFGHGYESIYSLLFISILIVYRKVIWQEPELRYNLIYFCTLAFGLAAISPGKSNFYLLYHMPYVAMIVAILFHRSFSVAVMGKQHRMLIALAILYVVVNIPHSISVISRDKGRVNPVDNAEVMQKFDIQPGDRVVAPLTFIFNALEQVSIRGVDTYFIRANKGMVELSADAFFKEALLDQRKFVLLHDSHLGLLNLNPNTETRAYGYAHLGQMNTYHVFGRMDSTL